MNCAQHTELAATAFCRECGTPICQECQRPSLGSVYCNAHAPVGAVLAAQSPVAPYASGAPTPPAYTTVPAPSPYTAAAPSPGAAGKPDESVHPVLALLLGLAPGLGAIYNGQYAKGFVHAVVFGLLVNTIINVHSGEALVGIMIAAWVFYMAFEAYHTARKRRYGVAVEEFSSQFDFRVGGGKIPTGAILLIGLGFILLLDTTDIIPLDSFERYWPLGLIILGVYLLYNRLHQNHNRDAEAER